MANLPAIEKLLDYHVAQDGTAYYQVKWKPTWERADTLLAFSELIEKFWKFVNESSTANITSNGSVLPKPAPVLPDPPPVKQEPHVTTPVTPTTKQAIKRKPSNSQTPRSSQNKITRTPSSSTKQNKTPRKINNQLNMASNPMFQNNMGGFGNQMVPPVQRNNSQSAVIIDSDDDDDVLISNPTPQQNIQMQNNIQPGNQMAMNSPNQIQNTGQMNTLQSNMQFQNNSNQAISQSYLNTQPPVGAQPFQNDSSRQANTTQSQILPNGLNMFHPANRFVQNSRGNNPQTTLQGVVKTEPSNQQQMLYSPNQVNPQPNMPFGGPGGPLQSPMGNQSIKRSLSMPIGQMNTGQQIQVKPENVGLKEEEWSGPNLQTGDGSGQLPPNTKWQDYCETVESFVNGARTNVTYRCRLCSATIAQKGNFSRHFNSHVKTTSKQ